MAKVNTNISLDPTIKKKAVKLFSSFGLDLSSAITLYLSQAVREQRIPFEIRMDIPNETTKKAFSELDEIKKNKKKYKRYDSFNQVLKELD